MDKFVTEYLDPNTPETVLDIGSCNVNGCYRRLFSGHEYTGGDLQDGRNVKVIFPGPYDFGEDQYSVVVSGQCLEHVEDTKRWMLAVGRVTLPSGIICVIAPNNWPEHRYPVDCWRILPDGMRWLFGQAGLEVIDIKISGHDTIGIARQPAFVL